MPKTPKWKIMETIIHIVGCVRKLMSSTNFAQMGPFVPTVETIKIVVNPKF